MPPAHIARLSCCNSTSFAAASSALPVIQKPRNPIRAESAGRTVAGDWFARLERFAALASAPRRLLIDGGDADQPRTDAPVFGWRAIGHAMDRAFA